MWRFSVWAPGTSHVELEIDGRRVPMNRTAGGWWEIEEESAGPGTDYRFVLDEEGPYPDPRSPWQPEGVHGASRVLDHGAFVWTDRAWRSQPLSSAVIYELHVGTFSPEGTFDGAIERLGHLADLGITHVELMPVVEFSGERGWGYDGVDLFAPHHAYGGPESLKRFVDACHGEGMAVILDVVYNHFGPEGAYVSPFGPYHTKRHVSAWGDALNFDGAGSDEVRRFFIDNALMWLRDYHMDGLRLDAIHTIVDTSAKHFLESLAEEVWALEGHVGRPLTLIAESDANDPRVIRSREAGGYGIQAQWLDDFRHSLHAILTGESQGFHGDFQGLSDLATSLRQGYVYCGRYSRYRDRRHGRPTQGLPSDRFVGYLQNHDQVGNRARGERSSHLMSPRKLKIAAGVVMMSPFVPMLFQGEEWGASTPFLYFTDHSDPELARAVTEGRKREFAAFGWNWDDVPDPQSPETFLRSKLAWSELDEPEHRALLEWHRDLIRLRREFADLTDPRLGFVETSFDEAARWMVLRRGRVAMAVNFGQQPQAVRTGEEPGRLLLSSDEAVELRPEEVMMPAESVAILEMGRMATSKGNVDATSACRSRARDAAARRG